MSTLHIFPASNPALANKILFEFLDIYISMKIKTYLVFGTLLGFYRDGTYLPGDSDIDIYIQCSKYLRNSLISTLRTKDFEIDTIPGASPSMNIHTLKETIFIDVWFNFRKSLLNFCTGDNFLTYYKRDILIPFPVKSYLVCAYDDWMSRIPKHATPFGK